MPKIIKVDDVVAKNLPKVAPALAIFYREDKIVELLKQADSIAGQLVIDRERFESEFSIHLEAERAEVLRDLELLKEKSREEARVEAKKEVYAQYSDVLDLIESIKKDLEVKKETWINESEEDIVKLTLVMAEKLMGQELSIHPDKLITLIKTLLKNTSEQRHLTIQVSPADLALVEKHLPELKQVLGTVKSFNAEPNISIKPGGIIFEMDSGILDARIDTQMAKLYKALIREPN